MTAKVLRKIIKIDEELCNGCGECVPACAEGALQIIDGKAKLVSEVYCDGLGACLGECPQGAITIEERDAAEFNEEAVEHYLHHKKHEEETLACGCPSSTVTEFDKPVHEEETLACGCSVSTVTKFDNPVHDEHSHAETVHMKSLLGHWPVQLTLVPPTAPFLKDADVMLVADCVPFAYAGFHQDFLKKDHALLVACPKLDDFEAHLKKLTDILSASEIKSLTVVRMEVPCCAGLVHMAKEAIRLSGKNIPLGDVIIGMRGDRL